MCCMICVYRVSYFVYIYIICIMLLFFANVNCGYDISLILGVGVDMSGAEELVCGVDS